MKTHQLIEKMADMRLTKSIVKSFINEKKRNDIRRYIKRRSMVFDKERAFRDGKINLEDQTSLILDNILPVNSPLLLISQIQRSGGTLLSQLFDGHKEIYAHPDELKIGYRTKYVWPEIDLQQEPENWFDILFEDKNIEHLRYGYKKGKKYETRFPFLIVPYLQKKIFLKYLESFEQITKRDVFDTYMTSYFNAWLDNRNLNGVKKYISAFTPRLAFKHENIRSFFDIYPDGYLISIIRDPKNWYPSALRHKKEIYGDMEAALDLWKQSAISAIRNKKNYGNRVCIIRSEDLIGKTDTVMEYLSDFLGIQFESILLTPTFNRYQIKANTSFVLEKGGIMKSALLRYQTLNNDDLDRIKKITQDTYSEVLEHAVLF